MQRPGSRAPSNLNSSHQVGNNASLGASTSRTPTPRSREPSTQRIRHEGSALQSSTRHDSPNSTDALVRRVLCPAAQPGRSGNRPLHELLPPLTSSNDVDLELYAIIAIVMRDFVYSWYGKITSDHTFVEEVVQIIAHCTRDLEQRFRRLDLESLVLDEIPAIVEQHISTFRTAHHVHELTPSSSPHTIYHSIFPHPALSPEPINGLPAVEQLRNEAAYRQLLVQGVLAVLLPTEDLQNACLRTLVADVIADLIVGNGIGGKASEGWLLCDGIVKSIEKGRAVADRQANRARVELDKRSRLEKFGLLTSNTRTQDETSRMETSSSATASGAFWRMVQYCYMTFTTIRIILVGLLAAAAASRSAPSRERSAAAVESMTKAGHDPSSPIAWSEEAPPAAGKRPILAFAVFRVVSQLLELPRRMPWTLGLIGLVRYHLVSGGLLLGFGAANGILNAFLHETLKQHIFRSSLIPSLLQTLRQAIFPNNALGPARPTPSPHEQRLIKRRAARAILSLVPAPVAARFFATARTTDSTNGKNDPKSENDSSRVSRSRAGATKSLDEKETNSPSSSSSSPLLSAKRNNTTSTTNESVDIDTITIPDPDPAREAQLRDIERVLDVFGDKYMTKHLLYAVVELVVVRLVPEMGERSVRELMEERIGRGGER